MDEPLIQAVGLTKRYGDRTVVDGLDLAVARGEIYGLLGPNGAGKTTTILMLLGLSDPDAGTARVVGLDPTRHALEVKRRVGYLPDDAGFYADLTGRQNLRYTARLNGLGGRTAEDRVEHVLDQVGLTDAADRRAGQYSRGMRQRLGIADALVKDPTVLILDEPTIGIDPLGVVEILELIRRLVTERRIALLLASHLLDQVQATCDRIGIFYAGRLIGEGALTDLAARFGRGRQRLAVAFDESAPASLDDAAVERLLASLPGVDSVQRTDRREPIGDLVGSLSVDLRGWLLTLGDGVVPADVRRELLARVGTAGLPLAELRLDRPVARGDLPRGGRARDAGRDRVVGGGRMNALPAAAVPPSGEAGTETGSEAAVGVRPPRWGWTVVARKELADHLHGARSLVLLIVLAVAALDPPLLRLGPDPGSRLGRHRPAGGIPCAVHARLDGLPVPSGGRVRRASSRRCSASPSGSTRSIGERAERTLPRLLAQPIHRDDVINGKFAAALAMIALMLVALTALIAGFGLFRLGIVPSSAEVIRIAVWIADHHCLRGLLARPRDPALGRIPAGGDRCAHRFRVVAAA